MNAKQNNYDTTWKMAKLQIFGLTIKQTCLLKSAAVISPFFKEKHYNYYMTSKTTECGRNFPIFEVKIEQLLHNFKGDESTEIWTDHKTNLFIKECCCNFPFYEKEMEQLLHNFEYDEITV